MGKVKKYEDVDLPLESKKFIYKREDEKPLHFDKEDGAIIDLLKLIQGHLKAIEQNTFKGY